MMELVTSKILQGMLKNQYIEEEDLEIYEYGLQILFLKLIHTCSIFIIGLLLGIVKEIVIFMICYSLLRTYTGGFHAKTSMRCIFISLMMVLFIWITLYRISDDVMFVGNIISSIVILLNSPVISDDVMAEEDEIEHNKRRSGQIVFVLFVSTIFFLILHVDFMYAAIFYSLFFCSLFLVASKRNS